MTQSGDPIAAILRDPHKARSAAEILGQAYVTAFCVIRHNRDQVAYVADELVKRKELFGDEVVELLGVARARGADHRHHRRHDLAEAVSDEHDVTDDERPREADVDAGDETEASFEQSRHRPPDLVGTRPEWDPAKLVPTETPRAAAGRLWAPAGKSGDTEVVDSGVAATADEDARTR